MCGPERRNSLMSPNREWETDNREALRAERKVWLVWRRVDRVSRASAGRWLFIPGLTAMALVRCVWSSPLLFFLLFNYRLILIISLLFLVPYTGAWKSTPRVRVTGEMSEFDTTYLSLPHLYSDSSAVARSGPRGGSTTCLGGGRWRVGCGGGLWRSRRPGSTRSRPGGSRGVRAREVVERLGPGRGCGASRTGQRLASRRPFVTQFFTGSRKTLFSPIFPPFYPFFFFFLFFFC